MENELCGAGKGDMCFLTFRERRNFFYGWKTGGGERASERWDHLGSTTCVHANSETGWENTSSRRGHVVLTPT